MIDEPDKSAADLDDAPVAEEAQSASDADRLSASAESADVENGAQRRADDDGDGPEQEPQTQAPQSEQPQAEEPQPEESETPQPEPEGRPLGEKHWYILKVQSNREDSIRDALQRRIAVAGLQDFFDEIIVPIEMVSEFKNGKKRVVKRKLYPGYIVVHMELNEDTWFLVRETPGIGDFTGSGGKPTPMLPHEVSKIVAKQEDKSDEPPKLKIDFNAGDRVKIKEGTFENFEGDVDAIDEANGRVTVMINIFGRSTPVELEYWQIESL